MACRLPGEINSPEQLWCALLRGDDLITEIPPDRWDADEYYDPQPGLTGRSVSKWGAFLDDVAGFDSDFFGINEREATALDPQHRLLLENSWEAMEHAGLEPECLRDSLTGVFVGLNHSDYQLVTADSPEMEGPNGFRGNSFSMASGRIAQTLGLRGPALTVDSADSSGLVSVHAACRSLNDGESDLAFAGGAFVMLEPRKFLAETAQNHLSPTGRCRAFDIAADGYTLGEGSAVVLLKRLSDALTDGDRILAVIRGTAAGQSGHAGDSTTPTPSVQTAVYEAALNAAGVNAGSVGMVEAHGAGTPVGDVIEYTSLAQVYGVESPCALTSVKTNLGHAQAASGLLGLIKAVLALQHAVLPPNLHFTRLPDQLARTDTRLFVPREITEWPSDGSHPRRAAVSSLGVSGTNVHAILEQAPQYHQADVHRGGEAASPTTRPLLFPLSSTSAEELNRTAGRLADWVQAHDDVALPDLAYTLARRRARRPLRSAVVANSRANLIDALRAVAAGDTPHRAAVGNDDRGPVWVFSGPESQWGEAGAQLLTVEPTFAATVAQIEPMIARESGFSVTEAISAPRTVTGVERTLPTLFTVQVALAAALNEYGVRPGAVIGHSLGEVAAAVVAGALTLEDGLRVICSSSRLMSRVAGKGAMASVELPAKQVLSELTMHRVKDVVVAIVASPQTTVISGAGQTVQELLTAWQERNVTACEIASDVAVHSPQVDPILDELTGALAALEPGESKVPFYSASQFDPREQPVCDGRYWIENIRRTVRFAAAVRAALEDGYRVFAELAPHPLLTDALERTADSLDLPLAALATMRYEQPLPNGLSGFVTELHSAGAEIDFSVLCPSGRLVDAPLPTWSHRRLWLSSDENEASTHGGSTVSVHPLLGQHVRLREEPERHVWQAEVSATSQPWLADHRLRSVAVLPAAAYCEMALATAHTVLGNGAEVRDIRFENALSVDEPTTLDTSAAVRSPGVVDFTVTTNDGDELARHASAVLHGAGDEQPPTHDISSLLSAHPHRVDGAELRDRLNQHGVQYGPAFAGLGAVHTAGGKIKTALAELTLPRQVRSQKDGFTVHPALLDACFQVVAAHPAVHLLGEDVLTSALRIRRVRAYGAIKSAPYCYLRLTKSDIDGVQADLDLLDENGTVLLTVEQLLLGTAASEKSRKDRLLGERLLTIEWLSRQLPDNGHADARNWLLISTTATDLAAATLTDALKKRGAQCATMNWPADGDVGANSAQLGNHLRTGGFYGVVVLTELRSVDTDDRSPALGREYVQHLTHITHELLESSTGSPHLYVVTRNARTVIAGDVPNLEQAGLRGLMRAIGTEQPHLRAFQIDLDDATDIDQLAAQLLSGSEEDETAWRNGQWYIARLSVAPLRPDERKTTVADHQRDGMRLQIRTPRGLESLELVACERVPPGPGHIEVAVTASSVNFADVLLATARYPALEGYAPRLGRDFAGVVTAVSPDVVDRHVGERVGGVANGCWGSFITCDANLAVPLPTGLSDSQAAAIATAHATAWYGLRDLAGIASGDKVLIHSATGGVGQAAIAIARAAGAEIFATAGSEQRRQMLRDTGIEHVYDSRRVEFAEAIRRETDGYGVDVVLNSVTGAAQRAGIDLLACGGRFIEMSQRDSYADPRLGLFPIRRNLSFYSLDLAVMSQTHPQRIHDLLQTVYRSIAEGELPIPESARFQISDASNAVRLMSSAQHTGKLVLEIPRGGRSEVTVPPDQVPVFRRDGAYIVTCGLGKMGLFLAEKMAAAGCGRIVLSSRSEPTLAAMQTVERIRATGTTVEVQHGDVAAADTVRRLVAAATATGLPVRGVLHLAAVVEEATPPAVTDELIEHDWATMVYGAWNLHTATTGQPLDWFCLFSSAAELVGSPGRGAYAAADSWLNAFALWRRAHGLPANAIAWGSWAKIGRAADADTAIAPDEGAYALEVLLRHNRGYTGCAPIAGTPSLIAFAHRSPFAEAFRPDRQQAKGGNGLRAELGELPKVEWAARLRRLISDQVKVVLRRKIDPDRPLAEYGVDSLAAMELLNRVDSETGIRLTSSDIASASIRDLAALLCERLESVDAS